MTLAEVISEAAKRIGGDSPRLDAEWLLAHAMALTRAQVLARSRDHLAPLDAKAFEPLITRRIAGEPVAYLVGEKGFWTLTLKVSPAVLVPRPETELLVEWALALLKGATKPAIADLGTGSGCIALALAKERPDAQVLATDLSSDALAVARTNAQQLKLRNVQFARAAFGTQLPPQQLIVSNPPYIAARDEHLKALRHEPLLALTDGADGLECLREVIASAPASLLTQGWLLVEHGYDQGAAVRELFTQAGFAKVETRRDLAGHERATGGQKP